MCLSTVGVAFFEGEFSREPELLLWTSSPSKHLRKLLAPPALEASSSTDVSELSWLKRTALIGVLTPKSRLPLMLALASLNSELGV